MPKNLPWSPKHRSGEINKIKKQIIELKSEVSFNSLGQKCKVVCNWTSYWSFKMFHLSSNWLLQFWAADFVDVFSKDLHFLAFDLVPSIIHIPKPITRCYSFEWGQHLALHLLHVKVSHKGWHWRDTEECHQSDYKAEEKTLPSVPLMGDCTSL